ncbi:sensor histidine kinase [Culicoidibacter larvae]|uniref:histidine kinase n=1 Tax=Culicoidibacter larvae TaxID=2579976 RepID=A0A5R8Q866_9FIRM|nr:ATP-binding protein [Culicoidibacter larvae]TLG71774.1 HAMP domain-containing histidine kinase [Culicoidibacter larvae]
MNNKKTRRLFYVLAIGYFAIVVFLVFLIYQMPLIYTNLNTQHIESTKTEIQTAINTKTGEDLATNLARIQEQNNMELVVVTPEAIVYSSMPTADFAMLTEIFDGQNLSYEGAKLFQAEDGTSYQVWVAFYKVDSEAFFANMLIIMVISVVILTIIIGLLLLVIFRQSIKPLTRLRDNINKLRAYRLKELRGVNNSDADYDLLSKALGEFTDDLQGKFDTIGTEYTLLEQQLQEKQELYQTKMQMVQSLVHDTKAPISMELFSIKQLKEALGEYPELIAKLDGMQQNNEELMAEIIDMMHIIKDKESEMILEKEIVDLAEVVRSTIRRFDAAIQEKNLFYSIDMPQKLPILVNKIQIKQLLFNIISNVCQYTEIDGEFELVLYDEDEQLHIIAANEVQDTSKIDFGKVFELFYLPEANDNNTATGIGMYTIKHMVDIYNGTARFEPSESGVVLTITIPNPKEPGDSHA